MTPHRLKTIRLAAGHSHATLANLLRIQTRKTIWNWEVGKVPVSGPASILLEMLEAGELPERYLEKTR